MTERGRAAVAAEVHRRARFEPRQSTGLFVGVSKFEGGRWAEVPYAADDAVDLAHLFAVELGLLLPQRTRLALAGEPRKEGSRRRLDELRELGATVGTAHYTALYRQLRDGARGSGPAGLFVLAMASHGVSNEEGDYLVAADTLGDQVADSALKVPVVLDRVARARAPRRLMLLDACRERLDRKRSGRGAPMEPGFADAIASASGLAVLSGATLGGYAYDDDEVENGVFTRYVLDGLRGAAKGDERGLITVRTLADFVQDRVVEWVRTYRSEDSEVSLGIARNIEGPAESLPLAVNPVLHAAREHYRERREQAIARLKENHDSRFLSFKDLAEIEEHLPPEIPRHGSNELARTEELLAEIEALDGTRATRRSLKLTLVELREQTALQTTKRPEGRQSAPAPGVTSPGRSEPRPAPAAGDLYENSLGMRFRFIPAGRYALGSPDDEPGRDDDERRHEVELTRGFWLAETPLTQRQWGELVQVNPSYFHENGEERPVEEVNWYEAVAFANRLSEREERELCYELESCAGELGKSSYACRRVTLKGLGCAGYRLPTEAEWEIAARAGTESAIWTGGLTVSGMKEGAELEPIAWFRGNSRGRTHAVGGKPASPWGLHDMLGNVDEWVWDWKGAYPEGISVDPTGPEEGSLRVIRGGSWYSNAQYVRAAYRFWHHPGNRLGNLGFRLALGPALAEPGG